MATKHNLLTVPEWFEVMWKALGFYPGLAALEQAMIQSSKHKVCVECLGSENLVHRTGRELIKCTDYYMCQDCLDYYQGKG